MKHLKLPYTYICRIVLAVITITGCNSFTVTGKSDVSISPEVIDEQVISEGEKVSHYMQLSRDMEWEPTKLSNAIQASSVKLHKQPFIAPLVRLRGGAATDSDHEQNELDSRVKQKNESFFEQFISLVDDPEAPLEEIRSLLNENKDELQQNYGSLDDDFEYTTLHYLAERGETELVKYVVEDMHVDLDITNGDLKITPLQYAALRGHLQTVKYLVSQGANLAHRDSQNNSVMLYAVTGGHLHVVRYLIEAGASMAPEDNTEHKGLNLLHMAIIHNGARYVDALIELMQSKGADLMSMANQCTELADRATPLTLAEKVYGKNNQVSNKLKTIMQSKWQPGLSCKVTAEGNIAKKPRLGNEKA